jgi:hypothetical protein
MNGPHERMREFVTGQPNDARRQRRITSRSNAPHPQQLEHCR